MTPSERLAVLNLELPGVAVPVGSYLPAIRSGNQVFTSGQLPMRDGQLVCTGKVPSDVSVQDATEGASIGVMNALAAAAQAAGGVDNIVRVVKVNVFVNSSPDFTEQPKVANGASDLLVKIFGDAGKHARAAVGVAELPLDAPVEVDLLAEVTPH
ncbi:MAG: RidA family protein [Planctomycetota bacterium]|jgi:enamine deaminase RidA (YjgF/YER057c/UK114 family)